MEPLIKIENLTFSYGKELVLDRLCATFHKDRFSVILGRNGSGKSTLFNILAGLQKKYEGSIYFADQERRQLKSGKGKEVRIGFLSQFHQTTFPFSVEEVLLTGLSSFTNFAPSTDDYKAVANILLRFELLHLRHKSYTSLSGGERQLVLLCRVLLQKPTVLLLDEPTNHLDLYYQVAVLKCIQELTNEGTTVLCVMHDPNLAFMFGEYFYIMQNNQLVNLQELASAEVQPLLEETFQLPLIALDNQGKMMYMPKI